MRIARNNIIRPTFNSTGEHKIIVTIGAYLISFGNPRYKFSKGAQKIKQVFGIFRYSGIFPNNAATRYDVAKLVQ